MIQNLFYFFITTLLVSRAASEKNVEEARRNALEKIDNQMRDLKGLINDTLTNLPIREANLQIISKHVRETGNNIYDSTYFDIHKTAVSGLMARILLRHSEEVARCIEMREKEGYKEVDRYYIQKFLNPGSNLEVESETVQSNRIKEWIEEYNAAVGQFSEIYENVVDAIQRSNDEDEITSMVRDFMRNTREMENLVMKVNDNLDGLQLQFLQVLDNLVLNIRNSMRLRVDNMIAQVRECFFGKNLLLKKLMLKIFQKNSTLINN